MTKSDDDNRHFRALVIAAVADLDAIGPKPPGRPAPFGRREHPDLQVWEQQVAAIGREFYSAAREAAQSGNAVAEGYIGHSTIDPTKIDARWAQAIRAMLP